MIVVASKRKKMETLKKEFLEILRLLESNELPRHFKQKTEGFIQRAMICFVARFLCLIFAPRKQKSST